MDSTILLGDAYDAVTTLTQEYDLATIIRTIAKIKDVERNACINNLSDINHIKYLDEIVNILENCSATIETVSW